MKVIGFIPAKKTARLKVETVLDLWHLENIIEKGDLVTGRTPRTIFVQREEKKEKVKKKLVVLTIRVEKKQFHRHANMLRISGKITEAPEEVQLGSHHTIEVGPGKFLTLEKHVWKPEQIDRLERAKTRIENVSPKLLEEFFIHLHKADGLVVYGFEQVEMAAGMGAVGVVLMPEKKIKDKNIDELVRKIESKRGRIMLVSEKEELGKRFCRVYDIAAILRFSISF